MATAGQLSAYSSAASSPTTPGGAACPSAMTTPETGNRSLARFDHAHSRKSGGGHTPRRGTLDQTEKRRPIAMVLVSTATAYPHPRHTRTSARRQSGQHPGLDPNFPAHSPRTSNPPNPVNAFAQVTGLRSNNLLNARTRRFSIPPPGIRKRASDHVSAGQRPSHARGGR